MSNSVRSLIERLQRKRAYYDDAIRTLETIQGLVDDDDDAKPKPKRKAGKAKRKAKTKRAKTKAAITTRKPRNMDPVGSIARVLKKAPAEGLDRNTITRRSNLNRTTATRTLAQMIKAGTAKRVGWGKYAGP